MFCKFKTIDGNNHQCQICGYKITSKSSADKIFRQCVPPEGKSLLKATGDFVGAMGSWAMTGFAGVTQEEKERRLEICKVCEHYDSGTCKLCRCNMELKTLINGSKCPIDKW